MCPATTNIDFSIFLRYFTLSTRPALGSPFDRTETPRLVSLRIGGGALGGVASAR